jgi:hypothetical protein
MRMQTKCTRAQRAAEYLRRVAALAGAKEDDDGTYHLTAGGTYFLVDVKFVRVIAPRSESTCFSVAADLDMPSAEVVASALQLKNNASLFEKWRDWPAHSFKANGQMFRDTYQLTRDETRKGSADSKGELCSCP